MTASSQESPVLRNTLFICLVSVKELPVQTQMLLKVSTLRPWWCLNLPTRTAVVTPKTFEGHEPTSQVSDF